MKRKTRKTLYASALSLTAFILWTAAVKFIDVSPIGPDGSVVGFATINSFFHKLTGVNMSLYIITDWLSLVPVGFVFGFALVGLIQLLKRKRLFKVDYDILILGGFYVAVMTIYVLFEFVAVNYRPVLINGVLEASYPSSTTMLVMCIIPTAIMQLNSRLENVRLKRTVSLILYLFTLFMFAGRLLSGVHWLSDIVGGALVSAGLVMMYKALIYIRTE